jgi:tetratricopeptide (TPR) repeat protein/transcriptional regulator with XRE-family HTH domain
MSPSAFGSLLRQQRRAAGLTQEELAALSGLSVRAISDLERGSSRPYRRTAETLAGALGLGDRTGAEFLAVARAARMPDAQLSPPAAPDAGPASSVPRQLPGRLLHFAGREVEVKVLDAALDEAGASTGALPVLVITGAPGVGKTSLAFHWAHQVADRFPDGQLFVNLRGFSPSGTAATPGSVIRGFLDALDVPADRVPSDLEGQQALYRSVLAGKRVLIVVDNARDAAAVRPLLPGPSGSAVLVTSRDRLMGLAVADGAFIVPLEPFTDAEADDLLTRRLGPERVAVEPAAAAALIEISTRLPLALGITAALAAAQPGRSLASLVNELSQPASALEALDTGDPSTTADAVISWSYRHLSPPLARVFRGLGLHPGPDVSAAAVASLVGRPVAETQVALRALTDTSLVAEQVPGRYTLHDLLRTFAAAQPTGSGDDPSQAVRRLLDHYLHTAFAADRALNPAREPIRLDPPAPGVVPEALGDHDDAMTWFEIEHKVLVAAVSLAAAHGFVAHAWQLPWTLVDYFERRGYWSDWLETQRIALTAAQDQGDLMALAHASRGLGIACSRTSHDDDAYAHYAAALGPFRELGDAVGEARVHQDISWLLDRQGRPADALPHDETALRLYQEAGRLAGQANALNAIGWLNAELGNYRTTLEYCRRALELQRELGNLRGQAAALDSLGYAHFRLGEHAKAVGRYQQSLQAFRQLADRPNQADVLIHLGDVQTAAGDRTAALDAWRLAFVILSNLHHPDADQVRAKLQDHGSAVPDVAQDCR